MRSFTQENSEIKEVVKQSQPIIMKFPIRETNACNGHSMGQHQANKREISYNRQNLQNKKKEPGKGFFIPIATKEEGTVL